MRTPNADLSADEVRDFLDYNPHTGEFRWRPRRDKLGRPNTLHCGHIAGYATTDGYWHITIRNRTYKAHRLAWLVVHGEWPPELIDHRNRIKHDNRIDNLRLASNLQNGANFPLRSDNKSGYTGVYWDKNVSMWRAAIGTRGKTRSLGTFEQIEDAAKAYRTAAIEAYGEYAGI